MTGFVKLDHLQVAAFTFTRREKDYGGIWLGVGHGSCRILRALLEELRQQPPGHSRSVPLCAVPPQLPEAIRRGGRRIHRPLTALRIGAAADGKTRFSVTGDSGWIALSPAALIELGHQLDELERGVGDLGMGGDSGEWGDRLRIWPLGSGRGLAG